MKKLKMLIQLMKISLSASMTYRADFLLEIIGLFFHLGLYLATIAVLFFYTSSIAGWKKEEVVLMLGLSYFTGGIFLTFIKPGLDKLPELIHEGDLDIYLLKPIPVISYLVLSGINLVFFPYLLSGLLLSILAVFNLDVTLFFSDIIITLAVLTCGVILFMSIYLVLMCVYFWTLESNIEHLFLNLTTLTRYPLNIFNNVGKFILSWIIPFAFLSFLPTRIILHKADWWEVALVFPITFLIAILSLRFWRFALKSYTSASS